MTFFKSISPGNFFLLSGFRLRARDSLYYKEDDESAINLFIGAIDKMKPYAIVKKIFLHPGITRDAVIKELNRMNENIKRRENL